MEISVIIPVYNSSEILPKLIDQILDRLNTKEQNYEIILVDEFTGRTMVGRRWSDGLHQAVEAKEGLPIQDESQTLASITYQNYFKLY